MEESAKKTFHWRDLGSLCAGVTLVCVLSLSVDVMSVYEGWLVYVGGALISAMAAGAMTTDDSVLSWVTAGFGIVPFFALMFTGAKVPALTIGIVLAAAAAVVVLSGWSAVMKSGKRTKRMPSTVPERIPAK